jgi:hypothetical protein
MKKLLILTIPTNKHLKGQNRDNTLKVWMKSAILNMKKGKEKGTQQGEKVIS